ncbi:MAG: helix-turn-helix domain-containing protein [Haloechinothrix sp.]
MHEHPNTLDYRLHRVAEITGLEVTEPDGIRVLAAALTADDVRRGDAYELADSGGELADSGGELADRTCVCVRGSRFRVPECRTPVPECRTPVRRARTHPLLTSPARAIHRAWAAPCRSWSRRRDRGRTRCRRAAR